MNKKLLDYLKRNKKEHLIETYHSAISGNKINPKHKQELISLGIDKNIFIKHLKRTVKKKQKNKVKQLKSLCVWKYLKENLNK